MTYYVIGDEDTVLGFGMVGVKGVIANNSDEVGHAFQTAITDPENGIVLITERLADLIRPLVDDYMFTDKFPLILELPDREGRLTSKPSLREMVNAAIGIRL